MFSWILTKMTQYNVNSPAHKRYHGLYNQGATCYLNSVLQALFMTKDFRDAVRTCENHEDFIDPELKVLFENLEKENTETWDLTRKLGIDRVFEQRDAAEYFEKILLRTSSEASQIFHGRLDNKATCSQCKSATGNDAPFWFLPLPIVKKDYSVEDGIDEFFQPSEIKGQMYCETCDTKVDAVFENEMKHHPDVLVLLLKRFNFSYQYMSYIKNNQAVIIPNSLHIPKDWTYELYAVVDHFGDLRSGHYATKIKIQEDGEHRWFNFDDARVTLLDARLFQENTEKSQNAYLLFYRRQTKTEVPDVTGGSFPPNVAENSGQCQDAEENREEEEEEEEEEEGAEVTSVTSPASNNPHSDPDRHQEADERKETQEHEDEGANVDGDDLKGNREQPSKESEEDAQSPADAETAPDIDHGGRRSASDQLHKEDARNDTRKRRMDAKTDEDEPAEAKKGKSAMDQSGAEHPSDGGPGRDVSECAGKDCEASREEDEKLRKTDADGKNVADEVTSGDIPADEVTSGDMPADEVTSGDMPADEVTSGDIPADDQRSQQDVHEQNERRAEGDDCVISDQQGKKDCLSNATHDDDDGVEKQAGDEGDVKEVELKGTSSERGAGPTETQVSEKMRRESTNTETTTRPHDFLLVKIIDEILCKDTQKLIETLIVSEYSIPRAKPSPEMTNEMTDKSL